MTKTDEEQIRRNIEIGRYLVLGQLAAAYDICQSVWSLTFDKKMRDQLSTALAAIDKADQQARKLLRVYGSDDE